MKKFFSKEVKIALAFLASAVALFIVINFLKGINVFQPGNVYYARYQNVSGLAVSSPVTIDGYQVGLVRSISYDYKEIGNINVEFSVDKSLKIPEGSRALIIPGMLGGATVELKLNPNTSKYLKKGEFLAGDFDGGLMGSLSEDVMPQILAMVPRIDSIMLSIQNILAKEELAMSLDNIEAITANLKTTSLQLDKMMQKDLPKTLNGINQLTGNLVQTAEHLNGKTLPTLDGAIKQVDKTVGQLNSTDNTIGLFLNDPSIYNNLNNTIQSADSLIIDLKSNPKRYVHFSIFGRK